MKLNFEFKIKICSVIIIIIFMMYNKYLPPQQPIQPAYRPTHRRIQTELQQPQHMYPMQAENPLRKSPQLPQKYENPVSKGSQGQFLKKKNGVGSTGKFAPHKHLRTQSVNDDKFVEDKGNKYIVEGIAGKGTFGVVYFGRDRVQGNKIAIKKVLQDKKYKNRELDILKILKHENVLQMRDHYFTYENGSEYLNVVMDYYSNNLYQTIKKKQLSPLLIKLYSYQILKGISYLSSLSIAHRDIKPQNILVDRVTHRVVICDFGSAKKLVKTQANIAYICSRCYRAPELIFGATDYSSQIDMWSIGCVIVQMINGQPPFLGDSQLDQLLQIIKILGTPSRSEVEQMNHKYDLKEYKNFPKIPAKSWHKVLHTKDPQLLDLIQKILQYSPIRRITPKLALEHEYFNQIKEIQARKKSKLDFDEVGVEEQQKRFDHGRVQAGLKITLPPKRSTQRRKISQHVYRKC